MHLALGVFLGQQRLAGGVSLRVAANGDGTMTITIEGSSPLRVAANGDGTMTVEVG